MHYVMSNEDLQEAIDALLEALLGNTVPVTGDLLRARLDELLEIQAKRAHVMVEDTQ